MYVRESVCACVFLCRCARLREAPWGNGYSLSSGVMDDVDVISRRRCFTGREWSSLRGSRVTGSSPANPWTDGLPTARATGNHCRNQIVLQKKHTHSQRSLTLEVVDCEGFAVGECALSKGCWVMENCPCLHNRSDQDADLVPRPAMHNPLLVFHNKRKVFESFLRYGVTANATEKKGRTGESGGRRGLQNKQKIWLFKILI